MRSLDDVLTFIRGVFERESVVEKARLTEPSDKVFAKHVEAWQAPFADNARHNPNRSKQPPSYYKAKARREELEAVHPRTVFAIGRYAGDIYRVWAGAPLCVPSKDGMKLSYFIEEDAEALVIVARYIACLSCSGKGCSKCRQSGWTYTKGKKIATKLGPLEELRKLGPPTIKRSIPAYDAIALPAAARRPARRRKR